MAHSENHVGFNGLSFMRQAAGVIEHRKISKSKHQITNKYQIPISNHQTALEF
jgi:hypothetical protein